MAIQVNVDGKALIQVGTGTSNALEDLGYTIDGVQIIEIGLMEDIPGDENGGVGGLPVDIQYMGEFHIVRVDMSKFDPAILAKVTPRLFGGTEGESGSPGQLMSADDLGIPLKITSTSRVRTYGFAVMRESNEHNKGTKWSRQSLTFHCYPVAGVIWT